MNHPADMKLILSLAAVPGTSGYKMHNAGYKAMGLNALYLPRRYDGDIALALEAVRALGIRGASLTMPYKLSSIPYLDAVSPEASAIGAVNTIVNEGGRLIGYNTDAPAAKKLIKDHLPWQNKLWVILGAGGMAHALAYVAKELNIAAFICARNADKAKQLAQRFKLRTLAWGSTDALEGKIICNATPIGMATHTDKDFYFKALMGTLGGIFDAVANPADTTMIMAARAAGLPLVSGDMLAFEQACLQFELYTKKPAPRGAMQKALYA